MKHATQVQPLKIMVNADFYGNLMETFAKVNALENTFLSVKWKR